VLRFSVRFCVTEWRTLKQSGENVTFPWIIQAICDINIHIGNIDFVYWFQYKTVKYGFKYNMFAI
jgi:hypothetical protein